MNIFKLFRKDPARAKGIIQNSFDKEYFLGKRLGQGAFATVFECIKKQDSSKYAVKIIKKARLKGEYDAVLNEIDILKHISHPNVVSLVDMYQTPEAYYLVIGLATGGELFDRILAKGSYTEVDAARLVRQILEALRYLHDEVDIVHRDLKPENLLFRDSSEEAELMITDFGLSREQHDDQFLQTTCGSPHYVSPEVLRRQGHGKPVDMWSLGVITYVLLSGYTPFWGGVHKSNQVLFQAICEGRYDYDDPAWDNVSSEAKDFIRKLLCVDQQKRYTAVQALEHPWLSTEQKVDLLPSVKKNFDAKGTFKKAALLISSLNRMQKGSMERLNSGNNSSASLPMPPTIPEAQ